MRRIMAALVPIALLVTGITAAAQSGGNIVSRVRAAIAAKEFDRGHTLIDEDRSARGVTPEAIEALSWLARGTFAAGRLDEAAQYSADTHDLVVAALKTRRLEDDTRLQTALGPPSKPTPWCGPRAATGLRPCTFSSGSWRRIGTVRFTSGSRRTSTS